MAGSGNKIKIGAAWVTFGSVAGEIGEVIDLGYTKGGVTFSMETQSHEVTVDQEGISPVRESILGRRITVTVPLAESDYTKLQALIPDSTVGPDATGTLLQIRSGLGADLMEFSDVLTITSKDDTEDWIKVYYAAPITSLNAPFVADRERIWPAQFKGFIPPVGNTYAGILCGLHLALYAS
jgi:hypothetical protein